jgi:D-threonate/D-erythronate kinase
MAPLLVIADDLTGALEAGAKFAGRGLAAVVSTRAIERADCPVLVTDTESRHLSEDEAYRAVAAVACPDFAIIYKKTDSALRGNIGAELRALSEVCPDHSITYIPGYPALGRIVKNGCLFVDGVPVHQTTFAVDPLNPVRDSSIRSVLGADFRGTICGGETDPEIAQAVAVALAGSPRCILAGPASVAAELANLLDMERGMPEPCPRVETCLIVNGSLHEASARQIRFAEQNGCASTACEAPWRIVPTPLPAGFRYETVDAVMVFGGDTALSVVRLLGDPPLKPIGEVVNGVAVSRVGQQDLILISKAGSFGNERLICEVKRKLHVCE